MTRFVVFEPPPARGDEATAAPAANGATVTERAVFVRDAFSIWGFLFPWLWLLRYGLLLSAVVVFLFSGWLGRLAADGRGLLAVPLLLLVGLLVALEGPSLRAWRFRRRGWTEAGVVEADNRAEAAILYYAAADDPQGAVARPPTAPGALPWGFAAPPPTPNEPKRRRWWPLRRRRTEGATA